VISWASFHFPWTFQKLWFHFIKQKIFGIFQEEEIRRMRRYSYPSMQKQLSKCEKVSTWCNVKITSCPGKFSPCLFQQNVHISRLNSSTIYVIAWGMVCERTVEPKSKMNRAHRVSMTTLWAATTRHRHTEKTVETNDSYHMLTMKKRGTGGLGEKLDKIHPVQRKTRHGLTSEAKL